MAYFVITLIWGAFAIGLLTGLVVARALTPAQTRKASPSPLHVAGNGTPDPDRYLSAALAWWPPGLTDMRSAPSDVIPDYVGTQPDPVRRVHVRSHWRKIPRCL